MAKYWMFALVSDEVPDAAPCIYCPKAISALPDGWFLSVNTLVGYSCLPALFSNTSPPVPVDTTLNCPLVAPAAVTVIPPAFNITSPVPAGDSVIFAFDVVEKVSATIDPSTVKFPDMSPLPATVNVDPSNVKFASPCSAWAPVTVAMVLSVLPESVALVSAYVLIALADASVSSDPETLVKSVSNTPDFKSATSMFEIELPVPSTSNVF